MVHCILCNWKTASKGREEGRRKVGILISFFLHTLYIRTEQDIQAQKLKTKQRERLDTKVREE